MGERDQGKPDTPLPAAPSTTTTTSSQLQTTPPPYPAASTTSVPTQGAPTATGATPKTGTGAVRPRKIAMPRVHGAPAATPGNGASNGDPTGSSGWMAGWRQMVWDKWRWGVLIALAVIVSRITSGSSV